MLIYLFNSTPAAPYRRTMALERAAAVSVTVLLRPTSSTRRLCLLANGVKIKQPMSVASRVKARCHTSALMMVCVLRRKERHVTVLMDTAAPSVNTKVTLPSAAFNARTEASAVMESITSLREELPRNLISATPLSRAMSTLSTAHVLVSIDTLQWVEPTTSKLVSHPTLLTNYFYRHSSFFCCIVRRLLWYRLLNESEEMWLGCRS